MLRLVLTFTDNHYILVDLCPHSDHCKMSNREMDEFISSA